MTREQAAWVPTVLWYSYYLDEYHRLGITPDELFINSLLDAMLAAGY